MNKNILYFALFLALGVFISTSEMIKKNRVLVLLDSVVLNTTHSLFFDDLRGI